MAILDFLIVCVNYQPALLGYLCDINTSSTTTFGNSTILQPIVELLRWSTQVKNERFCETKKSFFGILEYK